MDDRAKFEHILPITLEVNKGETYLWCSCGKSNTPPMCDGNDCGENAVSFIATANEDITFCNCKQTNNPPFCDGSHAKLLMEIVKSRSKK